MKPQKIGGENKTHFRSQQLEIYKMDQMGPYDRCKWNDMGPENKWVLGL